MSKTEKKVEVRFGAFSCSIEGYDDPVDQLRDILGIMQKMIAETPALAETSPEFDPEPIASALGAETENSMAPGVVVIRSAPTAAEGPLEEPAPAEAVEVADDATPLEATAGLAAELAPTAPSPSPESPEADADTETAAEDAPTEMPEAEVPPTALTAETEEAPDTASLDEAATPGTAPEESQPTAAQYASFSTGPSVAFLPPVEGDAHTSPEEEDSTEPAEVAAEAVMPTSEAAAEEAIEETQEATAQADFEEVATDVALDAEADVADQAPLASSTEDESIPLAVSALAETDTESEAEPEAYVAEPAPRPRLNIFAPPPPLETAVETATASAPRINIFAPPPAAALAPSVAEPDVLSELPEAPEQPEAPEVPETPRQAEAFKPTNIFAPPPVASEPETPDEQSAADEPEETGRPFLYAVSEEPPVATETSTSVPSEPETTGMPDWDDAPVLESAFSAADRVNRAPVSGNDTPGTTEDTERRASFEDLLQRVHGAAMMGAPGEATSAPDAALWAEPSNAGMKANPSVTDAATLAQMAGDTTITGELAASAAWLTLVEGRNSFARRDVMQVLDTIPSPQPRALADRIRGFGRLVRSGRLVLVDDGVFAMTQQDRDDFQQLLDQP